MSIKWMTEKCDTKKIHTHDEILSSLKKEWNIGACYSMMNLKNIMLSKREIRGKVISSYDSIYLTCPEQVNSEKEYRLAVARVWVEEIVEKPINK